MESCLFCRIANRELPARMEYEDESVVAFHDINPQAPVHILICPRKHIATLNDVSSDEGAVLAHMFEIARTLAGQLGIAQTGYRTVMNVNADGGQVVFHLHLHLIGGRKLGGLS